MRRKRPVRAAVAREASVVTEMTSDPGGRLWGPAARASVAMETREARCGRRHRPARAQGQAPEAARLRATLPASTQRRRRARAAGLRRTEFWAHRWPPAPAAPPRTAGPRGKGTGVAPGSGPGEDERSRALGLPTSYCKDPSWPLKVPGPRFPRLPC